MCDDQGYPAATCFVFFPYFCPWAKHLEMEERPRVTRPFRTACTPNCPSRGEIPKILKLAWGKAFVEVVAMRRLACV